MVEKQPGDRLLHLRLLHLVFLLPRLARPPTLIVRGSQSVRLAYRRGLPPASQR